MIDLVRTCLWDLRSESESQRRALRTAQRAVDEYLRGDNRDAQGAAMKTLRSQVDILTAANAAMQEVIGNIRQHLSDERDPLRPA